MARLESQCRDEGHDRRRYLDDACGLRREPALGARIRSGWPRVRAASRIVPSRRPGMVPLFPVVPVVSLPPELKAKRSRREARGTGLQTTGNTGYTGMTRGALAKTLVLTSPPWWPHS